MQKKILMLLNAPYPADIRVKKESDALIKAGYEVHLLCLRKKNQPTKEEFEGVKVHRIDAGKNNYQLAFWDVIMAVNFIHPKFSYSIKQIIQSENIHILHVHDLPLAGTAVSLKEKFNLKVVLDMHENYPEALRTWFKWKKNPMVRLKNSLFMNPEHWTKYELKACRESDRIIAVVEEMKDRIINKHQIAAEKIVIVTNTEDKNFIQQKVDNSVYDQLKGKFILTYTGGIGPHRGVDTAIRGMELLRGNKDIHLAIVGFGSPAVMISLKQLTKELKLENVHFFGYQPFSKFYSYMSLTDVNLIPHQSNGHTDNTVPHKLFQGMMSGKPLLVSSCAPLKRIVEACQSGLIFEANDPKDFADKVKILYQEKEKREAFAINGINATIKGDLNWETTQHSLINLYTTL